MKFSPLITELIDALRCQPGIGPKSAQRIAFQLLERDRDAGNRLSAALHDSMQHVEHCSECRILTEQQLCEICSNPSRLDSGELCIVESPANVIAIEQTGQYKGRYFVLMGHLSPLDGIGPADIGINELETLLQKGLFKEVILATNPTMEGDATAHYIADICSDLNITASRIAHGVPVGGELEYVDGTTLIHAFTGRKAIE